MKGRANDPKASGTPPVNGEPRYLTERERLTLAADVLDFVFERYPLERCRGQADALLLALHAHCDLRYVRALLGGE